MESEGVPCTSASTIELDHHQLLFDLKKLIEKWFLLRRDSIDESPDVQEIYYQIKNSISSVLSDGLLVKDKNQHSLLNELHWLHSTALRQEPLSPLSSSTSSSTEYSDYHNYNKTEICSIYEWISASLKDSSLCSKLQLLVSDKELLHNYYNSQAFLRNEIYTTALFICISALELNQSSLLSQIDNSIINEKQQNLHTKHRRSSSHPQFSISPKKYSLSMSKSTVINRLDDNKGDGNNTVKKNSKTDNEVEIKIKCLERCPSNSSSSNSSHSKTKRINRNFLMNRKWRSLPDIQKNILSHRPRSKTISQPISIPFSHENDDKSSKLKLNHQVQEQQQYTPGFDFNKANHSESTNSSDGMMTNHTASVATPTTSSNRTSEIHDLIPIQLVKCDDIKIYFDQSYNSNKENPHEATATVASAPTTTIPNNSLNNNESVICYDSPPHSVKSGLSPINFLSCMSANLFTTSSDENLSLLKDSSSLNNKFYSSSTGGPSHLTLNSNDFVSSFLPQEGEKLKNQSRRSYTKCNMMFDDDFLPDDYYDIIDYNQLQQLHHQNNSQHMINGQKSLAAFLQTAQFSRNNTDLERENAHFKISEAIIAIIEHMKWAKIERQLIQGAIKNSDRNDSNNSSSNNNKSNSNNHSNCTSKSKRTKDELQIRASTSSLTDKDDTDEDSSNSEEDGYTRNETAILCKDSNIEENYGSVEDHAAYAEWGETNLDALSAEGVALSLISKFSDSQLPKASELTWLVSEEDVPQELLPMPESPSANPDDHFIHSFTRGTRDWAPPRQQIIFTDHPPPNRKNHLQKQKYRCAGCGMKVALMYAHRFRYCTYLGKYLCTGCHRNQISTIPAKVLTKWDFSYYPVCVFAYRLLEQMWTYPLFYVPDLNPTLYTKIKNLYTGKLRRIQLKYIQDFIKSCRFANKEQQMFDHIPTHLTSDPDKWAISDFIAVKNGHLQKYILELIVKAEEHVFKCMLCTARGFICELCSKDQIIYPWQSKVKRCDNCGSCFHQKCWNNQPDCVKCQRLRRRRQQLS